MGNRHSSSISPYKVSQKKIQWIPPTKITVFWDTENLAWNQQKRASDLYCALGVLVRREVETFLNRDGLSPAHVIAVHNGKYFGTSHFNALACINADLRNAGTKVCCVDWKLKCLWNDYLVECMQTNVPVSNEWLWIASSDSDFADDIRRAKKIGFKVGVVHNNNVVQEYVQLADAVVHWTSILNHKPLPSIANAIVEPPVSTPAISIAVPPISSVIPIVALPFCKGKINHGRGRPCMAIGLVTNEGYCKDHASQRGLILKIN